MANHAIALSALFLVFSTPGISSSTNSFQTIFDDVKEELAIFVDTTASDIRNLTDTALDDMNSGIVEMESLRDTLAEFRENSSDATCFTSLDKLYTAINTTIANATEEYGSLNEFVESALEEFAYKFGSIKNDIENVNSLLSSCGNASPFAFLSCISKSSTIQSFLKLIPTDIASQKTAADALITDSKSKIAAFKNMVTKNFDNMSLSYSEIMTKCGIRS